MSDGGPSLLRPKEQDGLFLFKKNKIGPLLR